MSISFASDNASGVLPEVMEALQACNTGHSVAYGDDDYTRAATQAFKELFGDSPSRTSSSTVPPLTCWRSKL